MRSLTLVFALSLPLPAVADCAGEIAALFDGGAWDPFTRANRHEVTMSRAPNGSETQVSEVFWDGPVKSINCSVNGCFLGIGAETWRSDTAEGPGRRSAAPGSTTRKGSRARPGPDRRLGERARMSRDGRSRRRRGAGLPVLFKPEPNRFGSWWGGRYLVWLTPDAARILRIEARRGDRELGAGARRGCASHGGHRGSDDRHRGAVRPGRVPALTLAE
ncbi:MAG: hypothetical protein R3D59_02605 [Paracoccaceae bacterium]